MSLVGRNAAVVVPEATRARCGKYGRQSGRRKRRTSRDRATSATISRSTGSSSTVTMHILANWRSRRPGCFTSAAGAAPIRVVEAPGDGKRRAGLAVGARPHDRLQGQHAGREHSGCASPGALVTYDPRLPPEGRELPFDGYPVDGLAAGSVSGTVEHKGAIVRPISRRWQTGTYPDQAVGCIFRIRCGDPKTAWLDVVRMVGATGIEPVTPAV